jgi:hypothetical protein
MIELVDPIKTPEPDLEHFVINYFRSPDGDNFEPIHYDDVPEKIKDDETTMRLLDGMGAEVDGFVYIVIRNDLH